MGKCTTVGISHYLSPVDVTMNLYELLRMLLITPSGEARGYSILSKVDQNKMFLYIIIKKKYLLVVAKCFYTYISRHIDMTTSAGSMPK